jgi:quercetin dioxygenase-like cupin family protein
MSNITAAPAVPPTLEEARKTHHEPIVRSPAEYAKEIGRFGATQMVFHPSPEHPTAPNAGVLTYSPGSGFPLHKHDFAQVWYVIEGECNFGGKDLKTGDIVYLEDPHFEHEMHTAGGCKILFVQYEGPTTGARPIYDGRFNQQVRRPVEQEDLNH